MSAVWSHQLCFVTMLRTGLVVAVSQLFLLDGRINCWPKQTHKQDPLVWERGSEREGGREHPYRPLRTENPHVAKFSRARLKSRGPGGEERKVWNERRFVFLCEYAGPEEDGCATQTCWKHKVPFYSELMMSAFWQLIQGLCHSEGG